MRIHRILVQLLFVFFCALAPTCATTLERMSLQQLARRADVVARVTCLASASQWERGQIWTRTEFEVAETFKGLLPRYVSVRLPGGRVGHLAATIQGVPRFAPGEQAILFLARTPADEFTVLSWMQGSFRIARDPRTAQEKITQESSGMAVFDPAARKFRDAGTRRMPLEEFRRRLVAILEQQRDGGQP